LCLWSLFFFSACGPAEHQEADRLNAAAYAYHYKNLDSTLHYALEAMRLAPEKSDGYAEACNNVIFVEMARMNYKTADSLLEHIRKMTDNQLELLVADVQSMRLCQRESRNKDFYDYRESALRRLRRIDEEREGLTPRQQARLVYAQSEYGIVTSAYFYYVGLEEPSVRAMERLEGMADLQRDTAQYLNYLYNVGAGGIITRGTPAEIAQEEFGYLMQCYMLSKGRYPYWEANSMQAISEHLQTPAQRDRLIADNAPAISYLNSDHMSDTLLAGNLAQRSLDIFRQFGDVYQIAGAYRTLGQSYWGVGDYPSALVCLQLALDEHPAIEQAPDLVASIREQLSVVYSAMDDKPNSDYNRNIYLDTQEQTRQDRQLEARAAQLDKSSAQLNRLILGVVAMILLVLLLLWLFTRMRHKENDREAWSSLLEPLQEWKRRNEQSVSDLNDKYEEVDEQLCLSRLHVVSNKRRYLEQRARVSLVNSVTPFIDRMSHEVHKLQTEGEPESVRHDRLQYVAELTDKINEYNEVLTEWIQMTQGSLNLKIESFPLQRLFDILQRGKMAFALKGITLEVRTTAAVVKADRTLTLFMINTMADNARKFTPQGGHITVSADETPDYVEISVADTGCGMTENQLAHVFDHKPLMDNPGQEHHGFGLMNCKGIIEKYRKISQIFSVCDIAAESEEGKGSRFYFRLPKGVVRLLLVLFSLLPFAPSLPVSAAGVRPQTALDRASQFADSAYYSNIAGTYARTMEFADSVWHCIRNAGQLDAKNNDLKERIVLDISNETAVAALALHQWDVYRENNKVYTQLFRERSADRNLGQYVRKMQQSEINKTVAVILLVVLLLLIILGYYFLYYRHRVNFRFAIDRVNRINDVLLSDADAEGKLDKIAAIWKGNAFTGSLNPRFSMPLQTVVGQIRSSLKESIEVSREKESAIELAEDECRKSDYENDRLHVACSVVDNCLSTLKHETMYYPSRIRLLADEGNAGMQTIGEVLDYYKELYAILSAQANRQVDQLQLQARPVTFAGRQVLGDKDMLDYLLEILQKQGGGSAPIKITSEDGKNGYITFKAALPRLRLDDVERARLFTPLTSNLQFLLCRQIVRDAGEAASARGCGIQAATAPDGSTVIEIKLKQYGQV